MKSKKYKFETKSAINILKSKGIVILKDIFSKKKTQSFKKKLEKVYEIRTKNRGSVGTHKNQLLYNYFYEDHSLLELIFHKKIDKILTKVLDNDYVLQSSNAQNRVLKNLKKRNYKNAYEIGGSWHTDSRYLGGKRLQKGFSYLVIIALDLFSKKNGPTKYVTYSENKLYKPPRRLVGKEEKKTKEIIMSEGSACIMDTGIWHKAGKSSANSRWSIFSIYTGWFVKPYYDYQKLREKNIKKIYKKLLHHYCTPPKVGNKDRNTLSKYIK